MRLAIQRSSDPNSRSIRLALHIPGEVAAKALPSHLVPRIVVRKDGRRQRYWVDPALDPNAQPATPEQVTALATIRSWDRHPLAKHLTPDDMASAQLLAQLGKDATREFEPGDWRDPIGGGVRHLKQVTDPHELADIQDRLDGSASHRGRNVKLLSAYDLVYDHDGFDAASAEIGNVRMLYHGVNSGRAAAVIATGLKTPTVVGSITGQMFGPGIYFADSSTKSAQYIAQRYTTGRARGVLLECDVALGKPKDTMEALSRGLNLATMAPAEREDSDWDGFENAADAVDDLGLMTIVEQHMRAAWPTATGLQEQMKKALEPNYGLNDKYETAYKSIYAHASWDDLDKVYSTYHFRIETAAGRHAQQGDDGDNWVAQHAYQAFLQVFTLHNDAAIAQRIIDALETCGLPKHLDGVVARAAVNYLTSTEGGRALIQRYAVPTGYDTDESTLSRFRLSSSDDSYDAIEQLAQALEDAYKAGAFTVPDEDEAQLSGLKALAHHSVHAHAGTQLKFDEFVVYHPDQVKIRRVLEVQVEKS